MTRYYNTGWCGSCNCNSCACSCGRKTVLQQSVKSCCNTSTGTKFCKDPIVYLTGNFTIPEANIEVEIKVSDSSTLYVGQEIQISTYRFKIEEIVDSKTVKISHNGTATPGVALVAVNPTYGCYNYPIYFTGTITNIDSDAVVFGNADGSGNIDFDGVNFLYRKADKTLTIEGSNTTTDATRSIVAGESNTVEGINDIVGGDTNSVTGDSNLVAGFDANVSTSGSIVAGSEPVITTGDWNIIVGNSNVNTVGDGNIIAGSFNNISGGSNITAGSLNVVGDVTGSLERSIIGGTTNTARGVNHIVSGESNIVGSSSNLVSGQSNTVNNITEGDGLNIVAGFEINVQADLNAVFGDSHTIENAENLVAGSGNQLLGGSGGLNTVSGSNNVVDGSTNQNSNNIVVGDTNAVGGADDTQHTAVFGRLNNVLGSGNLVAGLSNTSTNEYKVVTGNSNIASGTGSATFGTGLVNQGFNQIVVGQYNVAQGTATSRVTTDHALIVGTGANSGARANAFALRKDAILQMYPATAPAVDDTAAIAALAALGSTNLTIGALALVVVGGAPHYFRYVSGTTWTLAF